MARIVGHLSVAELEARCRAARDVTAARHHRAIWLSAQGRTVPEAAEILAFVPRRVTRLAARHDASGPAAPGDRRRRDGKAASPLTPDLLSALAERATAPPEDGGAWSGPKVALWMARQLGSAKVHPQRGWAAPRRIGWSIQAPRPRHARAAAPERQAAFRGGSRRRSRRPRRRIRTAPSRSGPRTSPASA